MTPAIEPAVVCAENIALLYLLQQVPLRPSRNTAELKPQPHLEYSLPFETERVLASSLAYLAGTKDGPEHVPAICLRELPASGALDVLVAVNKGNWADGDLVLKELEEGLGRIFVLLSSAASDSLPMAQDKVFTAVIGFCKRRIECRLRMIPSHRKKARPAIWKVLQDSIDAVKQLQAPPTSARVYLEQTRNVMKKIASWSTYQTSERMGELVTGFYDLSKIPGLGGILNAIPNKSMDPLARRSLLNTICKVGRYRGVALFLCRIAAEYSILRRARVVSVRLPEQFFRKTSICRGKPNLPSIASKIRDLYGGRFDMRQIYRILGLNAREANSRFVEQTLKNLGSSKIHAEIQLIFYCELGNLLPPPRVICSRKDACFLCNSFILMHGKFHIPRSHGKLYPGWRLPYTDLGRELQRFNDRLQQEIEDIIALLIIPRVRTVYPDPNESTLLTLPKSHSTLNSDYMVRSAGDSIAAFVNNYTISSSPSVNSSKVSISEKGSIPPTSYKEHEKSANAITSSGEPSSTLGTSPLASLPRSFDNILTLSQDQETTISIEQNMTAMVQVPWCFNVHIEHSPNTQMGILSHDRLTVCCCVKWLTKQEEKTESIKASIIDAELLQGEIILQRSELQNLLLLAKGEILQIRVAGS